MGEKRNDFVVLKCRLVFFILILLYVIELFINKRNTEVNLSKCLFLQSLDNAQSNRALLFCRVVTSHCFPNLTRNTSISLVLADVSRSYW